MVHFYKKFFLFLCPLIIGSIIIELMLRTIPNDYEIKKSFLNNNATDIKILILGNSHAYYGLNPALFRDKCYNASYLNQTIDIDRLILEYFYPRLKSLEVIILPVDYLSLVINLHNDKKEHWRQKNYEIYYGINLTNNPKYSFEIFSNSLKVNFTRIIKYYIKGESIITTDSLGYPNVERKPLDLNQTALLAVERHTGMNNEVFESNLQHLEQIVNFAQSNGISVLLYSSPADISYRLKVDSAQLKSTIVSTRDLSNKYSNCYYLDLFDSDNFESADFRDADHLNIKGSEKLSVIINDYIIHNKLVEDY